MAIWDDIANWFKGSTDNNIAANIPILGAYYNTAFPAPKKPQQKVVIPPTPQPQPVNIPKSKNINTPYARAINEQIAKINQLEDLSRQQQPQQPQQQLPQQPANPVMDQLMAELMKNLNQPPVSIPAPPSYTYDQLYDKYYDMVKGQYDPQKSALERQIAERKARYERSAADIQDLYASASSQFSGGMGGADFDQMQADETARLGNYQDYANNVYADSAANMASEFGQLGIGDVAAYSSPKQAEDLAYLQTLNQNSSDAFQRYLSASEAAAGDYSGSMQDSYSLAGAEQGDAALWDLNQYLDGANEDLYGLESQQETALNAMIMQALMGQDEAKYNWQVQNAQNQQASQSAIFDRLLAIANLQRQLDASATPSQPSQMDLLNQQYKQMQIQQLQQKMSGVNSGGQDYTKGILGATQYLHENAAGAGAQNLTGLLQQLLQQQQFREGRFESASGDILKMTPEQAAQYALQLAQQQNLSPQDTSAFINAIYAYYGRLQ